MALDQTINPFDPTKYLYLRELTEPRDNSVRLVVQEAVVNPGGVVGPLPDFREAGKLITASYPIESTGTCRTFELTWDHYVAYLVTEELVGSCGRRDDEVFTGTLFRIYTKSHFLEHLARDTGGHTEQLLHYKLVCLNHLIDVAAYGAPEIRQIGPILPA